MLFVKPCSACCCPVYAGMPEYAKGAQSHDEDSSNPNGNPDMMIDTKGGNSALSADMAAY